MSATTDYGEPWSQSKFQEREIKERDDSIATDCPWDDRRARIIACVNFMQGIPDPEEWRKQTEAALSAAREALKYACRMLDAKEHDVEFVKSALALLTPTKP